MSIMMGSLEVGMPTAIGLGVKTACVPPNGATLADAASELATDTKKALAHRLFQVSGQAGNVVTAPNRNCGCTVDPSTRQCPRDGPSNQPGAWQPLAIPGGHSGSLGDHSRCARTRHLALLELAQIGREQLEAVCVMTQKIAFNQHVGNFGGHTGVHAGGSQHGLRKAAQIVGLIARRACRGCRLAHGQEPSRLSRFSKQPGRRTDQRPHRC